MALRTRRRKRRNMRIIAISALVLVVAVVVFLLVSNGGNEQEQMPEATPTAQASSATPTATSVPSATPTLQPTASATPTALPTPDTSETLSVGDEGEAVFNLQVRLIELGYLNLDVATNSFGRKTETAVKKFQLDNDLVDDGVAGSETLGKIYAEDAKHSDEY